MTALHTKAPSTRHNGQTAGGDHDRTGRPRTNPERAKSTSEPRRPSECLTWFSLTSKQSVREATATKCPGRRTASFTGSADWPESDQPFGPSRSGESRNRRQGRSSSAILTRRMLRTAAGCGRRGVLPGQGVHNVFAGDPTHGIRGVCSKFLAQDGGIDLSIRGASAFNGPDVSRRTRAWKVA